MSWRDKRHRTTVLFPPWAWSVNRFAASPAFSPETRVRIYNRLGFRIDALRIFPACYFHTADISIGHGAIINHGCFFENVAHISVGPRAAIAPFVKIITSTHSIGSHEVRHGAWDPQPVSVGAGTWVGAGALILPGVSIADGVIVAAGAVVTADCEEDGLYAGVPARRVKDLPLAGDPESDAVS